ncbi:hypothetical protein [Vibrio rarus]|uniref:hypothetical protein n=1 Tax=Vibrio rarus TaxID=413403 RepID=UPI0021C34970|nr:hypothetical protein [Vibrio rarus]
MTTHGFSLMELLVCCVVLGMTGHMALLVITEQLNNLKIKQSTAQIYALLTTARDTAYGLKKDLWLHADTSSENGLFAIHLDNSPRTQQTIFKGGVNPVQVTGVAISTTFTSLRFSGVTGRPYGNGNISLSLQDQVVIKVIYHDITGRMRVCSATAVTYGYPAC